MKGMKGMKNEKAMTDETMKGTEKKDLGKILDDFLAEQLQHEIIGGVSIAEVIGMIDLDMFFSPVLPHPLDDDPFAAEPTPVEVKRWDDGRFAIERPGNEADFEIIPPESLKIMRARYLLFTKAKQRQQLKHIFED